MRNDTKLAPLKLVNSGISEKIAHKPDIAFRDEEIVEYFTLEKGSGTIILLFEVVPIWLSVLSPLCFKSICFSQYSSYNHLRNVDPITTAFVDKYLKVWKDASVRFKNNKIIAPNLILISGSATFLNTLSFDSFKAPTIVSFEFGGKRGQDTSKIENHSLQFELYRHCLNGGCTSIQYKLGFKNMKPPANLTKIKRCIGDFLNYGIQNLHLYPHVS